MEDLLQSQILDSCRLALPEGLRDLMSDISREVLRAQPPDLYSFIVSYLEAMLLARDSLCIACRVCRDVCQCTYYPELEDELRIIGLDGEDLETVKNEVMEYFDKHNVKEGNLLMKLFSKTVIDANLLPDIQDAVREAFHKHLSQLKAKYWVEAENTKETGQQAANHTLHYYDRFQEDRELSWEESATKIQAGYRGHLERISMNDSAITVKEKLAQIESSDLILQGPAKYRKDVSEKASTSRPFKSNYFRTSLSSTSLAGSLINLPKYIPYSVHDMTYVDFEERETERKTIDYTHSSHFRDIKKEEGSKKIGFYEQHVLHEIKSGSLEEEQIRSDVEEEIAEDTQSETFSVDENILEDKSVEDVHEEMSKHQNSLNEDTVNTKTFAEDILQKLVSFIEIKDYNETSINETNEDFTVAVNSCDEQRHFDYISVDEEYIEEEIEEEEYFDKRKSISNTVGSKAHIEMIKTLKKRLITLSGEKVNYADTTDDKENFDDTHSMSSD